MHGENIKNVQYYFKAWHGCYAIFLKIVATNIERVNNKYYYYK